MRGGLLGYGQLGLRTVRRSRLRCELAARRAAPRRLGRSGPMVASAASAILLGTVRSMKGDHRALRRVACCVFELPRARLKTRSQKLTLASPGAVRAVAKDRFEDRRGAPTARLFDPHYSGVSILMVGCVQCVDRRAGKGIGGDSWQGLPQHRNAALSLLADPCIGLY